MVDKAALRKTLKLALAQLPPERKSAWDALIVARVLAWWQQARPAALAVYWPLPGEPDLSAAYAELAAGGVRLALPVVVERHAALGFAEWTPGQAMLADRMGIAVPAVLRMVERPPALLIPCLGFNAERYRLGYGGGFYDRTLEAQPRALAVGVAYACQQAQFASAAHDIALDVLITEA
ncbi:MAG: 5-formyltetrahydrofolate cyclo-ligase [Pseudomonadota bacterium]